MVAKKRGLGRGLDALLGPSMGNGHSVADSDLRKLGVELLQRGKYQPRSDMRSESLDELAESIRAQGVVQPVIVRRISGDKYEIIAGERRWRAAQIAGLQEIPAVVRDVEDQAAMAMALIENIQREDLNPMEEAKALQRLIQEFDLTHQMAAEAVGRSRAAVSNLLRLFDLNDDVKALLENRDIEMGHARALLGLHGADQSSAAKTVSVRRFSVRETEQLVKRLQEGDGEKPEKAQNADPDIQVLQNELSEKLGAPVQFRHNSKGHGRLMIQYHSLDELQGILSRIR